MLEIELEFDVESSLIQKDAVRSGRPHREFVQRLRSVLWARQTRKLAKKSFGELDVDFLPERPLSETGEPLPARRARKRERLVPPKGEKRRKARVRAMDRIARHGDSPEGVWDGARNLVAIAAAQVETSEQDYRCPVWELMSAKEMPLPAELMSAARMAAERIGFCWKTRSDAGTLMMLCGPRFPGCPGNQDWIKNGAIALASMAYLDAAFVLAVAAWQAIDHLNLQVGQVYLDALDACCAKYDEKMDAGPFAGMVRGLLLERLVRRKWQEIHPRHWPYTTLMRRAPDEKDPRTPGPEKSSKIGYGLFGPNALRPPHLVPIIRRDRRLDVAEYFEEWAVHEGLRLGHDRALMGVYPTLKMMARIWPSSVNWRTFSDPDGRWAGPFDLSPEE